MREIRVFRLHGKSAYRVIGKSNKVIRNPHNKHRNRRGHCHYACSLVMLLHGKTTTKQGDSEVDNKVND